MTMNEESSHCSFCNRDNLFAINFSGCIDMICNSCLYERIFTNHINEFQVPMNLKIKCKCEKGYLNLDSSNITFLIKDKNEVEKNGEEEKIISNIIEGCECFTEKDKKGTKFSEYFCLDCLKFICEKCKYDLKNIHLKHRIYKTKELINYMKYNINNIDLQNKSLDDFEEKCENIEKKFENSIGQDLNNALKNFDDLIIHLNKIKKNYIEKYQKDLGIYLKTLRYIKIFYHYYYKDRKKEINQGNEVYNNILKLKYLNNISYELIDVKINRAEFFDKDLSEIKKRIKKLEDNINNHNLIKGSFIFKEIKKNYKLIDQIKEAHKKYINGLILTKNNNKIITSSFDYYMKVWDPNDIKEPIQSEKAKITNVFALKNGKILASRDNDLLIFEYKAAKKDKNKEKEKEKVKIKKKDDKEKEKEKENKTEKNKENENENPEEENKVVYKYEVIQSVTIHNKKITSLAELDDGTIISGGSDNKIIFLEEDPNNKQYKEKQIITTQKETQLLLPLNDFKLAYVGKDEGNINILEPKKTELNINCEIISYDYIDNCNLEMNRGITNCLCKINQGYFVSGSGDMPKERRKYHNIYIWKPSGDKYISSQIIHKAHYGDVNSIILLRDGRFASSSKDRTIKIWAKEKRINENQIYYTINEILNEFEHGLYNLIQLDDDRIVSTSSDNIIVVWKNSKSLI